MEKIKVGDIIDCIFNDPCKPEKNVCTIVKIENDIVYFGHDTWGDCTVNFIHKSMQNKVLKERGYYL